MVEEGEERNGSGRGDVEGVGEDGKGAQKRGGGGGSSAGNAQEDAGDNWCQSDAAATKKPKTGAHGQGGGEGGGEGRGGRTLQ